jgi:hypothetical protein
MIQPKTYLNIINTDYKINEDEFIILQSLLTNEYFEGLIPFQRNKYVSHITYDIANPIDTQEYSNMVLSSDQTQENMERQCYKEDDIYGNKDSYWKQILPKTAKELFFNNSKKCGFELLAYILQKKFNKVYSSQDIKENLLNAYNQYIDKYSTQIFDILKKQGKLEMINLVRKNMTTFETIIMSDDYYITNLDIWILASYMKLPIVLFSMKNFKTMIEDINWLVLGGNYEERYFFVRSPNTTIHNMAYHYSLITPSLMLDEVKGFTTMVNSNIDEYKKRLISFDTFISKYSIIV